MAAPLKYMSDPPSVLEWVTSSSLPWPYILQHLQISRLILTQPDLKVSLFDSLDEESVRNLLLTSNSIYQKCSTMYYRLRQSRRLSDALAPTPASSVNSALATPVFAPVASASVSPGGDSASSNRLGASESIRPGLSPMELSSSDEKTKSGSDSETDEEYGSQPEFTPAIIANVVQNYPQTESGACLSGLPTELSIMIFKNLDVIDAVCLGLASRRHYNIYSGLFGLKVKLNTRRIGQAGTVERSWEVVDKSQCSHCSSYRCQLYRHIGTWMGDKLVSKFLDWKSQVYLFSLVMWQILQNIW